MICLIVVQGLDSICQERGQDGKGPHSSQHTAAGEPCIRAGNTGGALLSPNDSFTKDQTLRFIDLMRQQFEADGAELP